jgi:hypothetical protein
LGGEVGKRRPNKGVKLELRLGERAALLKKVKNRDDKLTVREGNVKFRDCDELDSFSFVLRSVSNVDI